MGFGNIGWSGLVLVLVALLLVFGPSKLPEIGKAFGKSLREFKTATKGFTDDVQATPTESSSKINTNTGVDDRAVVPVKD